MSIGVKIIAAPSSAFSSTGISMNSPPALSGWWTASSRVTFAPSDVPPTTGRPKPEVVDERRRLVRQRAHRVDAHVVGLVGLAVAEQVDGDHAVAARGHLRSQAVVHAAVHQQAVNQDQRPVALAVDVVGDAVAAVEE